MSSFNPKALFTVVATASFILLGGCGSTQTNVTSVGPSMVGPGGGQQLGANSHRYRYNSDIYMDVAIPVFDPGFPTESDGSIDYDEIEEEGIWPQVRRLEANRFAIATKEALGETKSFGSINVTPDASALADVYILGKINYSDTETVEIGVRVMDAKNTVWGEEEFEYRVSEGWYRDAMSRGENPNAPVFEQIAKYVYDLLMKKSEAYKQEVQMVSDLRYAQMYSPEAFSQYLSQSRKGEVELVSAPSESDPMLRRVRAIQAKDEQFIDSLQETYDSFWVTTETPYRKYQKETLPEAKKIRELKAERTTKQVTAGLFAVASVLLGSNSSSTAGQVAAAGAGIAAIGTLNEAIKTNKELHAQRDLFDEMGQNLDIQVADQIVEIDNQRIELQGSASEQYYQLRSRLKDIYEMEATPMTAL
ncbi:hypothetical protein BM523_16385 [Alteromonas mediterranea]|jgi:hypothetical protein|uniref:Lipoprotein n=4 Tax=Pseudomonadota TaxID=1224 RepID=A0AAC8XMP8_9ALTE|nr:MULTISPECIES: hypothetical protein [Alteromonas]AGP79345.1 lipoprotein [Alteromonas mediterranea 615]AGP95143.1 lipoprotein [Alteromonas mediterranea U8]MBR9785047.1 hypothetical protein [Gammaproteobacteria bacterium]MDY6884280.1 hypothetical protein [Pseudomonadota bacterium]AEA99766.1 hypothetical protein MADE_1018210 [Alteromonas mediterranea DE]|tara:strand:- start:242 stop:1498 length:1257 start_codon:yes stop_codon:yes gene_type:complete